MRERPANPRRLVRPLEGRAIAGVCAGVARYLDLDTNLIRAAWIIWFLLGGTGALA